MDHAEMVSAILMLRPDAEFSLVGSKLAEIQWFSAGNPPSATEIEAAHAEILASPAQARPTDFPLTDRQLRLGLIAAGVLPSAVRSTIESVVSDPLEREAMLTWFDYTREIKWDHPVTQQLMAIAGFDPEQAAAMWMAAKDIEA